MEGENAVVRRAVDDKSKRTLQEILQLCDYVGRTFFGPNTVVSDNRLIDAFTAELERVAFRQFLSSVRKHVMGVTAGYELMTQQPPRLSDFVAAAQEELGRMTFDSPARIVSECDEERTDIGTEDVAPVAAVIDPSQAPSRQRAVLATWALPGGKLFDSPMTPNEIHGRLWGGKAWRGAKSRPVGYFDIAPTLADLVQAGFLEKEKVAGKRQYLYYVQEAGKEWYASGAPWTHAVHATRRPRNVEVASPVVREAEASVALDHGEYETRVVETTDDPQEVQCAVEPQEVVTLEPQPEPELEPEPLSQPLLQPEPVPSRWGDVEEDDDEPFDY